jgi:hypothetical protein
MTEAEHSHFLEKRTTATDNVQEWLPVTTTQQDEATMADFELRADSLATLVGCLVAWLLA